MRHARVRAAREIKEGNQPRLQHEKWKLDFWMVREQGLDRVGVCTKELVCRNLDVGKGYKSGHTVFREMRIRALKGEVSTPGSSRRDRARPAEVSTAPQESRPWAARSRRERSGGNLRSLHGGDRPPGGADRPDRVRPSSPGPGFAQLLQPLPLLSSTLSRLFDHPLLTPRPG